MGVREVSPEEVTFELTAEEEKEFNSIQDGTFVYITQRTSQETKVPPYMLWEMKGCVLRRKKTGLEVRGPGPASRGATQQLFTLTRAACSMSPPP